MGIIDVRSVILKNTHAHTNTQIFNVWPLQPEKLRCHKESARSLSLSVRVFSSHYPIGPPPYPVIYTVVNPVRGLLDRFVWMYAWPSHTLSIHSELWTSTGMIANRAVRGQLNKETVFFPCPRSRLSFFSREIKNRPFRPSPALSNTNNPTCGHKEVRRPTGHIIIATTRF